jgi:hypothetical protein
MLQNLYVKDVVVSPNSLVYAVTTDGLLVVRGNAWHKIDTLLDAAVSVAVDPTNPDILYAGTVGYGAHRSTDGGQNWQAINNGLGWQPGVLLRVSAITVDRDNPQHLALAAAYSIGSHLLPEGIYQSHDAGQHWNRVADSPRELVRRITIKAGGIYVPTSNGLLRYGHALPVNTPTIWLQLQALRNPSGVQALILALTLAFGIWVLVGRLQWLPAMVRSS